MIVGSSNSKNDTVEVGIVGDIGGIDENSSDSVFQSTKLSANVDFCNIENDEEAAGLLLLDVRFHDSINTKFEID
ncbi:10856_t:CDS:2 [Entrophospora sp. SA101]|nr:3004_t:CDS:2 [Entrophospora sp. SA101]CAJ0637075.1 10856_t:CDS:2 [Entrophospora sp. SA101]CAJ0837624.1 9039_t:CDS:2 [Entrophospora sp. SA101]